MKINIIVNALQMTRNTYSVFTFHMFVTKVMLHILIMFIPCLFISVFGFFVLHCVHCIMQIEWHRTTELLYTHCAACTRYTVHCTRYMGAWSTYENQWDYSFIYRRSLCFFSHRNDSPECSIHWFIDRGIQNKQFSVGERMRHRSFFSPFVRIWFGVDDFCICT